MHLGQLLLGFLHNMSNDGIPFGSKGNGAPKEFKALYCRYNFILRLTCSKVVLDLEANPLQLIITEEADPHEASTGEDQPRTD